jgi:hypothetical protein
VKNGFFLILWLAVMAPRPAFAQASDSKWRFTTSFSYGSENNVGNPGFMLTNEMSYRFYKTLELSGRVGLFHSMPWFQFDQNFRAFSSLATGVFFHHTKRFAGGAKFVRVSAGGCYFRTNSVGLFFDPQSNRYNRADNNSVNRFGVGLSVEGGGRLSQKIDLTFLLQVYSFEIFGDIIVVGPNLHIRI